VDLVVRQILTRSFLYEAIGLFLLSGGITLGCFLAIRIARETIDNQIAQNPSYLLIASTPVIGLPPATPIPTSTPTPIPTTTPPPPPAIRLSIPVINLNTSIKETYPKEETSVFGKEKIIWEPVAFSVGHYNTSGNPGEGANIVLAGHNNTEGAVFQHLDQLEPGDELILFTENNEFHYQVQKKYIIPYFGVEEQGDAILQSFAAPRPSEMVTLISCWPYATNSHRIVIIAIPYSR
jgi:sortase A